MKQKEKLNAGKSNTETRRAFNKLLIDLIDILEYISRHGSITYYAGLIICFFLFRKFVVVILRGLLFLILNVEPITE